MDPPAYTPIITPKRSIQDLRIQILANASILAPEYDRAFDPQAHLEVVVAKCTANNTSTTNFEPRTVLRKAPAPITYIPGFGSGSGSSSTTRCLSEGPISDVKPPIASSSTASEGKHYAVLTKRSFSASKMKIIIKGEPRDTVEEALEWLLEKIEMDIHDMVVRHGKME